MQTYTNLFFARHGKESWNYFILCCWKVSFPFHRLYLWPFVLLLLSLATQRAYCIVHSRRFANNGSPAKKTIRNPITLKNLFSVKQTVFTHIRREESPSRRNWRGGSAHDRKPPSLSHCILVFVAAALASLPRVNQPPISFLEPSSSPFISV